MQHTAQFDTPNTGVGGFSPSPPGTTHKRCPKQHGPYFPPRAPIALKPSRPNTQKIAAAVPAIHRTVPMERINALDEIVQLAGDRPKNWTKPKYGEFEYWLAHECGWISSTELNADTAAYEAKKRLALETSHRFTGSRFSWTEKPKYEEPVDRGEYIPQVNMKLIHDRNLTDSSRRIALFIMRHAYQHRREDRFIGMTVSFIMKGLALSRRTVQRSLTLLETRGYFRCEVVKSDTTKMCIGLAIRLLAPLFPEHHKGKWPERREKPGASIATHNKFRIYHYIDNPRKLVLRLTWAMKCMAGVARAASKVNPSFTPSAVPQCRGFTTVGYAIPYP